MGVLAFQFPNEEPNVSKGKWNKVDFSNLPEDCFFVNDFENENTFYFDSIESIKECSNLASLTLNSIDDLFVVNGKSYLMGLEHFIAGFEENGIQKAIYSRIKFESGKTDDALNIFMLLAQKYKKEALVYLISDEQFGTWIGATPEILLSGTHENMKTIALAGTKKEATTPWTDKEIEEHQYVVDYMENVLTQHNVKDLQKSETFTEKNGQIFHLKTPFQFSLPSMYWKTVITALHPTPAVCGTPKDIARNYILTFEPHQRSFYTGLIGRKAKEKLDVYVNLRCMQLVEEGFALYVGGGITPLSNIVDEWNETEAKSETILSILPDFK